MYSYEDYVRYRGYKIRYDTSVYVRKALIYLISFCILVPILVYMGVRGDKVKSNIDANIMFQYCLEKPSGNSCEGYDYYNLKQSKEGLKSFEKDLLNQYKKTCDVYRYDFNNDTKSYCTSMYNKKIAQIESEYPWYIYGGYEKERK